ncbi:nuclease-related domain-containing protein [Mucilaginibacter antarcticus]|uniref:Nuclease-related domain-containing protein n=1 Tax=Mucilaginibacter antarcticus TaxID=1855725 RepID=A0ABW5XKW1_9SPHI
MCKVYNTVGCITAINEHLLSHSICEPQSLEDLISFQKTYHIEKQQIISNSQLRIDLERRTLAVELDQLSAFIKAKSIEVKRKLLLKLKAPKDKLSYLSRDEPDAKPSVINYLKVFWLRLVIRVIKLISYVKYKNAVKSLLDNFSIKNIRYQFLIASPTDAVMEGCSVELKKLTHKKTVIDEINNWIYGAWGEQKVVAELEKLSDDWILINDFKYKFHRAVYRKTENDYIQSIQIDHILISKSGVFLIETKNWGENSINNPELYSPIKQISRANFALYRILNGNVRNQKSLLNGHFLGTKKVPIKNLLVLINKKPLEQFPFVKILSLADLLKYVNYFQPCFSNDETLKIANYLISVQGR